MSTVPSRDLRNHTAAVLHRVAQGDHVTVTVNGEPVAELVPPSTTRRVAMPRREFLALLAHHRADPAMRTDLAALTRETTDDLELL